ncbi:MAG: hypothetical protein JSS72_12740 [Armatimonadetes bacterium]|nr:hypothetical protein [Armatimonadota bacterium]
MQDALLNPSLGGKANSQASDSAYATTLRWAARIAWLGVVLLLLSQFLINERSIPIWDDGLMWQRYDNILLKYGYIGWNADGIHTYGLTSILFLIISVPCHLIFHNNWYHAAILTAFVGTIAFVLGLTTIIFRITDASRSFPRLILACLLSSLYFFFHQHFWELLGSGMDTPFSLLVLSGFLYSSYRMYTELRSPFKLALWAPALYLTRPDMCMFLAGVGLAFLLGSTKEHRAYAVRFGAYCAGMLAVLGVGLYLYFHSPVPLPFYAKRHGYYDETFEFYCKQYDDAVWANFRAEYGWLAITAALSAVFLFFKGGSHRWMGICLVATAGVFTWYISDHVMQVMGFYGRFYMPTVIAYVFTIALAIRYVSRPAKMLIRPQDYKGIGVVAMLGSLFMLGFQLFSAPSTLERQRVMKFGSGPLGFTFRDGFNEYFIVNGEAVWPSLDVVQKFDGDVRLASTEAGLPGAWMPNTYFVDTAGLNDTEIALHGLDGAKLLQRNLDVIYFHGSYPKMNASILNAPNFWRDYRYYHTRKERILDVAVRRDYKHFAELDAAFRKNEDENIVKNYRADQYSDLFYGRVLTDSNDLFQVADE